MPTPILDALIVAGHIHVSEHGEYVGTASDGTEVLIGQTFAADAAERYLADFPSPDMW
ncbi:hypothetical protein SEA_GAZEBO_105 [Microbacterium phage Gazebo]|nr:hypothetical protein SEA_GAZEBO_105 [Microbacterium phage Gazebo]